MSKSRGKVGNAALGQGFSAVILGDSYTHDFKPITLDVPRALMPLVNGSRIIDHALEFLISNGVEDIYIVSSCHSEKLKEHISKSRWSQSGDISLNVVVAQCHTPGDALRHLNELDLLRQDFVLIPCDLISNFTSLKTVWRRHIERRNYDASILMTLVCKSQEYVCNTARRPEAEELKRPEKVQFAGRMVEERITAVTDAEGVLLYYKPWVSQKFHVEHEDMADADALVDRSIAMDLLLFKDKPTIEVRSDLIDTNIVICSPELLGLFKENFDFFDIKHDCVKGILEEELLGNKIAVDIIQAPFLARVASCDHYAAVAHAMLNRFCYPVVPELDFTMRGTDTYSTMKNNVYICNSAKLSRCVTHPRDVFVGPGTVIEDGVLLINCTIGANCKIGKNTKIINSFLWDNVEIGDGCTLTSCMACDDVVVGSSAVIAPGGILACGVQIAPGHETIVNARIHSGQVDASAVGAGGIGYIWEGTGMELRWFDVHAVQDVSDTDSVDSTFEELLWPQVDGEMIPLHIGRRKEKKAREGEEAMKAVMSEEQRFMDEMQGTLHRAFASDHEEENCILEINGLKFAYDRSFMDCSRGIVKAALTFVDDAQHATPKEFREAMKKLITSKWKSVIKKFCNSVDIEVDALHVMADLAHDRKTIETSFLHLVNLLYDCDIISEEAILQWDEEVGEHGTDEEKVLKKKCEKFIEWLQEASEEEDDSDSD